MSSMSPYPQERRGCRPDGRGHPPMTAMSWSGSRSERSRAKLGVAAQVVRQAEIDDGQRAGTTSQDSVEIWQLCGLR
jgi:hypothetical protein